MGLLLDQDLSSLLLLTFVYNLRLSTMLFIINYYIYSAILYSTISPSFKLAKLY
ncbi:hypothetical protein BGAPBR_K0043 (plasmid) [Borreliella garinii PBr]|uniref:Uncharacterized protein n=1 Tax=Borreliella garinii PBr TaxID=498743 RepID=B8F0S6_BORGR|nr:hypothetical protein BGAPBR_K0043 [Borreliella garinii PBr]